MRIVAPNITVELENRTLSYGYANTEGFFRTTVNENQLCYQLLTTLTDLGISLGDVH
ncbi:12641_t:CDS:2 [Dentiscutata heterogama]|uniref:12641_t:CDS:1 n=1 Tax=Dentiscutata heterogama TaxID=1316150 RepID=A0ACA9N569_9GLOM|nr:12641_t:CDS:2 [Dentiscutata heterogama]